MKIYHNLPALFTSQNIACIDKATTKTGRKLSYGLRIIEAADDAAGLAISQTINSQIEGLNQAFRNSQDASSLIQTADGALTETCALLQRMRELSVQAANGTYTATDRIVMQKEIDQLNEEIDRIAATTSFNHQVLLDGTAAALTTSDKISTQVFVNGAVRDGEYKIDISADLPGEVLIQYTQTFKVGDPAEPALTESKLKDIDRFYDSYGRFLLDEPQILTLIQGDNARTTITVYGDDTVQDLTDKLNKAIGSGLAQGKYVTSPDLDKFVSYDPAQGTLTIQSVVAGIDGEIRIISNEALLEAFGLSDVQKSTNNQFLVTVTEIDDPMKIIAENVRISGNKLFGTIQPGVDVRFDGNADIIVTYNSTTHKFELTRDVVNQYTTYVKIVDSGLVFQAGADELQNIGAAIGNMTTQALGVDEVLVTDQISAGKAITTVDSAIKRISAQRAELGAIQNQLGHVMNNLNLTTENLTKSESLIRDADIASMITEYARLHILSQSGMAMMAHANQEPQSILQLLKKG